MCLFLREGEDGKYAERFDRLLANLAPEKLAQHARAAQIWSDAAKPSVGEALFRSFISEDLKAFEKEYVAFMRSNILSGR